MPMASMSHPDRVAATLANVAEVGAARQGPFPAPDAGAHDCRIDLKLLQWRALSAIARSAPARDHLAALASTEHADLWAGTVQDGVARGFAARLEEAISLAPPIAITPATTADAGRVFTGKELRKKKDLLVRSGGSRVRFSRKEGILFVDREGGVHSSNCVRFESRSDRGSLDRFVAAVDERPRLYSAQFLKPQHYLEADDHHELVLRGRLGNGPLGWDCELTLSGRADEATVRMRLRIDNRQHDQRLRLRVLGVPPAMIQHDCTPVLELVAGDHGGFAAFTLVRANGTLLVDGAPMPVPAAQCQGPIEHHFRLGTRQ